MINRRDFLKSLVAGAAGLLASRLPHSPTPDPSPELVYPQTVVPKSEWGIWHRVPGLDAPPEYIGSAGINDVHGFVPALVYDSTWTDVLVPGQRYHVVVSFRGDEPVRAWLDGQEMQPHFFDGLVGVVSKGKYSAVEIATRGEPSSISCWLTTGEPLFIPGSSKPLISLVDEYHIRFGSDELYVPRSESWWFHEAIGTTTVSYAGWRLLDDEDEEDGPMDVGDLGVEWDGQSTSVKITAGPDEKRWHDIPGGDSWSLGDGEWHKLLAWSQDEEEDLDV